MNPTDKIVALLQQRHDLTTDQVVDRIEGVERRVSLDALLALLSSGEVRMDPQGTLSLAELARLEA